MIWKQGIQLLYAICQSGSNCNVMLIYNIQVKCVKIIRKDRRILMQRSLYQLDHSRPKYKPTSFLSNSKLKQPIISINFNINLDIQVLLLLFPYITQSFTPLNRPLYIQIEAGEPSPYLKQLMSKVGNSQIQFMDFTLEGEYNQNQSGFDEEQVYAEMSPIKQQQQSEQKQELNGEEYISNMHLLDIDPSTLNFAYFMQTLGTLESVSELQRREYIMLYLTDQDLQAYKDASIEELIQVVRSNLQPFGIISKLERKAKVTLYLHKKKKRIWKKKINYKCRKIVADNRLRVKGKFVTKQQACQMLGIQICDQQLLKDLLKSEPKPMF